MKHVRILLVLTVSSLFAAGTNKFRQEAEYYVATYARHYNVPVEFVRAIVDQESGWQPCPISPKGAVGLMQLMPEMARKLKVQDACDVRQNISGGVRYLAALIRRFRGDLRLVAAAYFAGERVIERRGLAYSNADVVRYVTRIRQRFKNQTVRNFNSGFTRRTR
jgi:soluble lytic murein transglycosylase-like protein